MTQEKYLPVKQLASEMNKQFGIVVSEQFIRFMLRAGVPRVGYCSRLSDLMAWWKKHPNFSPRSKRSQGTKLAA